jgi:hypothetical protein
MSHPRPDPPRLPIVWFRDKRYVEVDDLLSDLRTLEAQWRTHSKAQLKMAMGPGPLTAVQREVYSSQSLVLEQVADDLAALLARLEGQ